MKQARRTTACIILKKEWMSWNWRAWELQYWNRGEFSGSWKERNVNLRGINRIFMSQK